MLQRLRPRRPSPAMLVAMIALVVAFGGSAIADSAVDLAKSRLINGKKIKPRTIRGNRVKRDTLTGKEISESKLAVVPNANKANSATTAKTADNATTASNANAVNGVTESQFTVGRSAEGSCDPSNSTFVDCASVTFTLLRGGRVLVVADTNWHSNSGAVTRGSCEVAVDGSGQSADIFPGQNSVNTTASPLRQQSAGINLVTGPLGAGSHTFAFRCNQLENDIVHDQAFISAVMIGSA
jgi:hypothetical protein